MRPWINFNWLLILLLLWNLQAEDPNQSHMGNMASHNWDGLGYWVVSPENGEYANWATRDYMILLDSNGRPSWFKPNLELLEFHKEPQTPDSIKQPPPPPVKKMVMSDTTEDTTQMQAKRPDSIDSRLWGREEMSEALERLGNDSRYDKSQSIKNSLENFPDDERIKGVEEIWE